MTKKFLALGLLCGGTFMAIHPATAGLNLSDAPMFVTEVLAPNVMIVPVEGSYANEVAMKSPPLAAISSCNTGSGLFGTTWTPGTFCGDDKDSTSAILTKLTKGQWYWSLIDYPLTRIKLLSPWPDSGGCKDIDSGYLSNNLTCSSTDLYGQFPNGGGTDVPGLNSTTFGYKTGTTDNGYSNGVVEMSYESLAYYNSSVATLPTSQQADPARMAYLRSSQNFLYFNPDLLYQPWKPLGSNSLFLANYDATSASTPRYHPLQIGGSNAPTIDLAHTINTHFTDGNSQSHGGQTVVGYSNFPFYLGEYFVFHPEYIGGDNIACLGTTSPYVGVKRVWHSRCYDRYTWDGSDISQNATYSALYGYYDNYNSTNPMPVVTRVDGTVVNQKINFANWFTYWRNSFLANRGMLTLFLDNLGPNGVDLFDKFRIGLANSSGVVLEPATITHANVNSRMLQIANKLFDPSVKFGGYSHWISTQYFTGTPNAINYNKSNRAYRDDPSNDNSIARSCRRNYEVVLTSDYLSLLGYKPNTGFVYRDASAGGLASYGDLDHDGIANTFGDAGQYGWQTDLSALPDTLLPSKDDSQTQQHLVRYIIGPSVTGNIFSSTTPPADYQSASTILAGVHSAWIDPAVAFTAQPGDWVDDLWHMALNSRGMFYPSNDVVAATQNLLNAFNDILVRNVSGSAVATNTASLKRGGAIYQATVESDWKGHLRAYSVTPTTNQQNQAILSIGFDTALWDLAEKVSAMSPGDRVIATYRSTGGVPFRWGNSNIGAAAQGLLEANPPAGITNLDAYGESVLNYLRGSGVCEDGSGTVCSAGSTYAFRRRNLVRNELRSYSPAIPNGRNVLGDIDNSNPWYVTPPPAGRSDLDYPGYNTFRLQKNARTNVLYVGANDGFLHAVKTNVTIDSTGHAVVPSDDGTELFAYAPSFLQANLYQLTRADYAHKFFVDGSPFSADIDVSDNGNGTWKTVLAGGANKGGKGYYLLDISDPASNTEANANDWVKWEFTSNDDAALNYTFNLPAADSHGQSRQIVRMNNGKAALIVGNGYPTEPGKQACLFIIYLAGPSGANNTWVENTDYRKICVGDTSYPSSEHGLDTNGLSTPTPYDTNGDGKIDVVYAGDLNGNMWRFDVAGDPTTTVTTTVNGTTTSTITNNWTVSFNGAPLFVARNDAGYRQPIIAPPEVASYIKGVKAGQLVLFGSGKYIESGDRVNSDVQSYYGVWDRGLSGITRSSLIAQVLDTPAIVGQYTARQQTTRSTPIYCDTGADLSACATDTPPKQLGWYWDMLDGQNAAPRGERLTGKSTLINGVILFNTFYPLTDTYTDANGVAQTELDPCQYGGDGWIMALDAVNGSMNSFPVFDLNQDGVVNATDATAAGVKVGAAIGGTSFARGIGDTKIGIFSPTNLGTNANQGDKMKVIVNTGTQGSGRVSWYELLE